MPPDRTVVEHLLEGREALVLEVERLTTAIEELDSVIARIGGDHASNGGTTETGAPGRAPTRTVPAKAASRARRTPARGTGRAVHSDGSKSIRVHVLEMLESEDRDFGLAEIIDRIHAQGIRAHDDAVRSITIKLMKDGRVERIGRGQYRLARRAIAESTGEAAAEAPVPDPAPAQPAAERVSSYVEPQGFDQNPASG